MEKQALTLSHSWGDNGTCSSEDKWGIELSHMHTPFDPTIPSLGIYSTVNPLTGSKESWKICSLSIGWPLWTDKGDLQEEGSDESQAQNRNCGLLLAV